MFLANKEPQRVLTDMTKLVRLVLSLTLILNVVLLLTSCNYNNVSSLEKSKSIQSSENVSQSETSNIVLPVATDIVLTKKSQEIIFYNPDDNNDLFDIRFILSEEGNIVYDSDWREPHSRWIVNLYELFDVGSHDVLVEIKARYSDTHKSVNGTTSNICVTVLQN